MLTLLRFADCGLALLAAAFLYWLVGSTNFWWKLLLNIAVCVAWREVWLREATIVWQFGWPSLKYGSYIKSKKTGSS